MLEKIRRSALPKQVAEYAIRWKPTDLEITFISFRERRIQAYSSALVASVIRLAVASSATAFVDRRVHGKSELLVASSLEPALAVGIWTRVGVGVK